MVNIESGIYRFQFWKKLPSSNKDIDKGFKKNIVLKMLSTHRPIGYETRHNLNI